MNGPRPPAPNPERAFRRTLLIVAVAVVLLGIFAGLRYATFHNRTFDLAFYARMAWGMAVFDYWDPILEAHIFGLHLSPILFPIGWLGRLVGTVPVLLGAQALAFGGAAMCLGRLGNRHLGERGWLLGALLLLLHPNVAHAATYEAHPGTLAIWPLAWALERFDAKDARGLVLATLGVLLCREDLALITTLFGAVALTQRETRNAGIGIIVASLGYFFYFALVLHPQHAPDLGSLQLHFGRWGNSFGEVLVNWLTHPLAVLEHLAQPRQLTYMAKLLAPFLALLLFAPRLWIPALPVLGINLMSEFPTSVHLSEHYTTPALPMLVAATLITAGRLPEEHKAKASGALYASMAIAFLVGGPWTLHGEYRNDDRSEASAAMLQAIETRDPEHHRSLQVPYPLLAHVAERPRVFRAPPPDRNADLVIVDGSHRSQWAHQETLLRTDEEPILRNWLSREDYGLVAHHGPWYLFERNADGRNGPAQSMFAGVQPNFVPGEQRLTDCLRIVSAHRSPRGARLRFRATSACPSDLGLRLHTEHPQRDNRRVDLLFEGLLSPRQLRAGDVLEVDHDFEQNELGTALYIGLVRSSGARSLPEDPPWVRVPIAAETP